MRNTTRTEILQEILMNQWFLRALKPASTDNPAVTMLLDLDETVISCKNHRLLPELSPNTDFSRFSQAAFTTTLSGTTLYADPLAFSILRKFSNHGHKIIVITAAKYDFQIIQALFKAYQITLAAENFFNHAHIKSVASRILTHASPKSKFIDYKFSYCRDHMLFDDLAINRPRLGCLFQLVDIEKAFPFPNTTDIHTLDLKTQEGRARFILELYEAFLHAEILAFAQILHAEQHSYHALPDLYRMNRSSEIHTNEITERTALHATETAFRKEIEALHHFFLDTLKTIHPNAVATKTKAYADAQHVLLLRLLNTLPNEILSRFFSQQKSGDDVRRLLRHHHLSAEKVLSIRAAETQVTSHPMMWAYVFLIEAFKNHILSLEETPAYQATIHSYIRRSENLLLLSFWVTHPIQAPLTPKNWEEILSAEQPIQVSSRIILCHTLFKATEITSADNIKDIHRHHGLFAATYQKPLAALPSALDIRQLLSVKSESSFFRCLKATTHTDVLISDTLNSGLNDAKALEMLHDDTYARHHSLAQFKW